jgi:hypothetical protein
MFGELEPFRLSGGVFILGNEDDTAEYTRRRNACLKMNGLTTADLKHKVRVNRASRFNVVCKRGGAIELGTEMIALGALIKADRAAGQDTALVIVDTQAASFRGIDENSSNDMAEAGALLDAWAKDADVSVLLVHHTVKAAWDNGASGMASSRGSSAMIGSVRFAAELVTLTPEEEERLPESERGKWVALRVTKSAYGALAPLRWFRKDGENLPTDAGNGVMGPSESSGAIKYQPTPPKWLHVDTSDDNEKLLALGAIRAATDAGRSVHRSSKSSSPGRACVVIAEGISRDNKAGGKMLDALLREGLLEEFDGKPRRASEKPPMLVKVSVAGEAFMRRMACAADAPLGDAPDAGGDGNALAISQKQPAARQPARNRLYEGPPPVLPVGVGVMDALSDIDFGAAQ